MDLKTIQVFYNATEARYWKSQIEKLDIPCFIHDEHLTSLYPGRGANIAGGIKLKVAELDFDLVVESFPGLALSKAPELLFCPVCQSYQVSIKTSNNSIMILLQSFRSFFDLLFPKAVKQEYTCQDCNHTFKS